jgi:hypothetical protein
MTVAGDLEKRQGKRASVMTNGRLFAVVSMSGRGLLSSDPDAFHRILGPTHTANSLGNALREALDSSRFLDVEDASMFLDGEASSARWNMFVSELMHSSGVGSRRALFKDMMQCNVAEDETKITFSPTQHEKLEVWKGLGIDTTCSVAATDEEIGTALTTALRNCT